MLKTPGEPGAVERPKIPRHPMKHASLMVLRSDTPFWHRSVGRGWRRGI